MAQVNTRNIAQLKSLSSFSGSQLETLARSLSVRNYKKDENIFEQEEEAKLVYLLVSGVVRFVYMTSHEKQTIVSVLPAGEFFGIDSMKPKARHPFTCTAFEVCTVGSIKPQDFIEILLGTSYENFLRWYMVTLHPSRAVYIHCIRGIGLDLRRRLALELLNLADSFGTPVERGVEIDLRLSHELLANIVGASRQQVTQHINEFDRERIIFRDRRRITIVPEKLRKVSGAIF
jgi:CRP/FNR family transcriptional regulator, cyclic AMP receptor protein